MKHVMFLPVAHVLPLYPATQLQVYWPGANTLAQVPPFVQGLLAAQSSKPTKKSSKNARSRHF